jgi:hypothetical protein
MHLGFQKPPLLLRWRPRELVNNLLGRCIINRRLVVKRTACYDSQAER